VERLNALGAESSMWRMEPSTCTSVLRASSTVGAIA